VDSVPNCIQKDITDDISHYWLGAYAQSADPPEVFANIARCGVNVFMTCNDSPEAARAQLDLAVEHGLQALVVDPRFTPTDDPDCVATALAAAKEYADHPATFGFNVCDEPVRGDFERVGRVVVEMQAGWKAVEVYKLDGTTETRVASPFHVGLEPGDGRLFRFERTGE
jgi:hypothetical protein